MYNKISLVKFMRNILWVAVLSGLFFGVLGWFVAGVTGLIYMAIMGVIICGAGCAAMQISMVFEVRSWQYASANETVQDGVVGPWFIKKKSDTKPSNP